MQVLNELEPREVFHYFEALSDVPRGSGHEETVSDWLLNFAKSRGLEAEQDALYNILIRKPGTSGYEDAPTVILHGHMDMVCKSDPGVEHDFLHEGLNLYLDDGYIRAKGTTLGADNGIGVAYFLALLDSHDIPHPPLEAVFTVMEEMGKVGSNGYDTSRLHGKRMLDLNYHEDKILAGCSGDVSVDFRIPIAIDMPRGSVAYQLEISELRGGHCEFDIVLERANAILLLARIARAIFQKANAQIAEVWGGVQNNVIPAEAGMKLVVQEKERVQLEQTVKNVTEEILREYELTDPEIEIRLKECALPLSVYSDETTQKFVQASMLIPNGVISMSFRNPGICETSNNIGLLREVDGEISIISTITSALTSRKHEVMNRIIDLAVLAGGGTHAAQFGTDAPEWPYNPDSKMLALAKTAFQTATGKAAPVVVMPASLELGLFGSRISGLDIVSIGTRTNGVHSPREELYITSVEKIWNVVKELMRLMKE